jgi:chromosomal replication initiation ATPase DnaA
MTAIAQLVIEGPFGNPDTMISSPSLNLRKNARLEEAREVTDALTSGKELILVARDTDDLMSYAVGSMIAKMLTKNVIDNVDECYDVLSQVFTVDALSGEKGYRFNRRTVFNTLQEGGIIREGLSIRDAKPAGTLPTISEISRIIENYTKINLDQIQSPARSRDIVDSRFFAIWAMRYVCGHSLTYIGEQMGNRDHTSILNGVNRVRTNRGASTVPGQDAAYRDQIDNICDESDVLALRRHHSILSRQSGIRRVV